MGVARITALLMQGQALTAKDVIARLHPMQVSQTTALEWLKTVKKALGEPIQIRHIRGATKRFSYVADHSATGSNYEHALLGLQLTEGILTPFAQTEFARSTRESAVALRALLDRPARDRAARCRHMLLRPERPSSRADLTLLLDRLVAAIRGARSVTFNYLRSDDNTERSYQINPWALVDYADGLYLFGEKTNQQGARRTFDVSLINALQQTAHPFTRPPDVRQMFEDHRRGRFGIFVGGDTPQYIELDVRGYARHFLQRRPLGGDQSIAPALPHEWSRLRVFVAPDSELLGRLLMLGSNVRVRSPAKLAERHHQALRAALRNYD